MCESKFHIHIKQRANYSFLKRHPSTYIVDTFRKVWPKSSFAQVIVEYAYGQISVCSTNKGQFKFKLQHAVTWSAVGWPPPARVITQQYSSTSCTFFPARKFWSAFKIHVFPLFLNIQLWNCLSLDYLCFYLYICGQQIWCRNIMDSTVESCVRIYSSVPKYLRFVSVVSKHWTLQDFRWIS